MSVWEKIATVVGLPVAGAVVHHLWTRFRQRLTSLRWSVQYQPMAFATHDTGWGKVEILYNGQPTQNLHMAYVAVQNASSRDLEDVRIDIVFDPGTTVLRSAGAIRGSLLPLTFASDYAQVIADAAHRQLTPVELNYWAVRSPFIVHVLNRGAVVDFKLLLSRLDYDTPHLLLSCDHKGVRVLHEPLVEETLGVRNPQAQVFGLLLSIALSAIAVGFGLAQWLVALVAWLTGAAAILLGAVAVRLWRGILGLLE